MPSVSGPQHRLMCGVAHSSINKPGLSKSVAQEFCHADKGKKFAPKRRVKYPSPAKSK